MTDRIPSTPHHVFATHAPGTDPERAGVNRLRIVSAALGSVFFAGWATTLLVSGDLLREFVTPLEWAPPVAVIAASLTVFLLADSNRLPANTSLTVGLLYQVVVSYGLVGAQHLGAFTDVPVDHLNRDVVGTSMVVVWMFAYTVLIPSPPRRAVIALIGSASAVPVLYVASVLGGLAPALPVTEFFLTFVLPYVLTIAAATWAAHVMYRLGVAAREAQELGSYRLEALLGRGGMGEVWRASHRMLARPAAIKLIRPEVLVGDRANTQAVLARFAREAQVTAGLQSPHTVELYDFGVADNGTLFYVMELLDGIDLETIVTQFAPLPAGRVIYVLTQVCASLGEAHRRGLTHRDVKPGNILLCRHACTHDVVKVLDFGLVKHHKTAPSDADPKLTAANTIAGTPAYMAPEMITSDDAVDGRADLYALGCVAYWLLTGAPVFAKRSAPAMLVAHLTETPEPPGRRMALPCPEALDRLVLECLAKAPDDRPPTAEAVARRLSTIPVEPLWTAERAAEWWERHRPSQSGPASRPIPSATTPHYDLPLTP